MDTSAKALIQTGDLLFGQRPTLVALWQEIANNCYIERADFTLKRVMGVTLGEDLMSSYPLIARRELANQLGSMLRPKNQVYAFMETMRYDMMTTEGKQFLAYANTLQRRAMYDIPAQFVRATKEGDNDYAAFGQCVIRVSTARNGNTLLYRGYHLRDVVWSENEEGIIDTVHVKIKQRAGDVVNRYKDKCPAEIAQIAEKEPFKEVELRHVMMPSEFYEAGADAKNKKYRRFKFTSIMLSVEGQSVIEEVPSRRLEYVIPRWVTVSGSQYAYSGATVVALPDMRLIQAMTTTLLEAGEKFTNPPMIAVGEAIRSDIQIFAGGITNVDAEYDEKMGEVLRPLVQDHSGFPLGADMRKDVIASISEAFYLNKLSGPPQGGPEKTAYQVGQEVQQYIRDALPLFEPMEQDYNGGLYNETFNLLFYAGAFGSPDEIPPEVLRSDVQFRFDSPLTNAISQEKVAKLAGAKEMLAQVADVEPGCVSDIDWRAAFRDAIEGNQTPMSWVRSRKVADQMNQQKQAAQQHAALLDQFDKGAGIVQKLADAGQHINPNTITPQNPPGQQSAVAA